MKRTLSFVALALLILATGTSFADTSDCPQCKEMATYSSSKLVSIMDESNMRVKLLLFNDTDKREPLAGAPILVYIYNSTFWAFDRTYVDSTGVGYYNFTKYNYTCFSYTFIYCYCPTGGCPLDKCLDAAGVRKSGTGFTRPATIKDGQVRYAGPPPEPATYTFHKNKPSFSTQSYCPPPSFGISTPTFCLPLAILFALLGGALYATGRNPFRGFDMSGIRVGRHIKYEARGRGAGMDLASNVSGALGQVAGGAMKTAIGSSMMSSKDADTQKAGAKMMEAGNTEMKLAPLGLAGVGFTKLVGDAKTIHKEGVKTAYKESLKDTWNQFKNQFTVFTYSGERGIKSQIVDKVAAREAGEEEIKKLAKEVPKKGVPQIKKDTLTTAIGKQTMLVLNSLWEGSTLGMGYAQRPMISVGGGRMAESASQAGSLGELTLQLLGFKNGSSDLRLNTEIIGMPIVARRNFQEMLNKQAVAMGAREARYNAKEDKAGKTSSVTFVFDKDPYRTVSSVKFVYDKEDGSLRAVEIKDIKGNTVRKQDVISTLRSDARHDREMGGNGIAKTIIVLNGKKVSIETNTDPKGYVLENGKLVLKGTEGGEFSIRINGKRVTDREEKAELLADASKIFVRSTVTTKEGETYAFQSEPKVLAKGVEKRGEAFTVLGAPEGKAGAAADIYRGLDATLKTGAAGDKYIDGFLKENGANQKILGAYSAWQGAETVKTAYLADAQRTYELQTKAPELEAEAKRQKEDEEKHPELKKYKDGVAKANEGAVYLRLANEAQANGSAQEAKEYALKAEEAYKDAQKSMKEFMGSETGSKIVAGMVHDVAASWDTLKGTGRITADRAAQIDALIVDIQAHPADTEKIKKLVIEIDEARQALTGKHEIITEEEARGARGVYGVLIGFEDVQKHTILLEKTANGILEGDVKDYSKTKAADNRLGDEVKLKIVHEEQASANVDASKTLGATKVKEVEEFKTELAAGRYDAAKAGRAIEVLEAAGGQDDVIRQIKNLEAQNKEFDVVKAKIEQRGRIEGASAEQTQQLERKAELVIGNTETALSVGKTMSEQLLKTRPDIAKDIQEIKEALVEEEKKMKSGVVSGTAERTFALVETLMGFMPPPKTKAEIEIHEKASTVLTNGRKDIDAYQNMVAGASIEDTMHNLIRAAEETSRATLSETALIAYNAITARLEETKNSSKDGEEKKRIEHDLDVLKRQEVSIKYGEADENTVKILGTAYKLAGFVGEGGERAGLETKGAEIISAYKPGERVPEEKWPAVEAATAKMGEQTLLNKLDAYAKDYETTGHATILTRDANIAMLDGYNKQEADLLRYENITGQPSFSRSFEFTMAVATKNAGTVSQMEATDAFAITLYGLGVFATQGPEQNKFAQQVKEELGAEIARTTRTPEGNVGVSEGEIAGYSHYEEKVRTLEYRPIAQAAAEAAAAPVENVEAIKEFRKEEAQTAARLEEIKGYKAVQEKAIEEISATPPGDRTMEQKQQLDQYAATLEKIGTVINQIEATIDYARTRATTDQELQQRYSALSEDVGRIASIPPKERTSEQQKQVEEWRGLLDQRRAELQTVTERTPEQQKQLDEIQVTLGNIIISGMEPGKPTRLKDEEQNAQYDMATEEQKKGKPKKTRVIRGKTRKAGEISTDEDETA